MFGTTRSMNIVGSYLKRSASEKVLEIFRINCENENLALEQNPYFTNGIKYMYGISNKLDVAFSLKSGWLRNIDLSPSMF